jgi:hypothetical protein
LQMNPRENKEKTAMNKKELAELEKKENNT